MIRQHEGDAGATHSRISRFSQNLHMMLRHTIAMSWGYRIAAIAACIALSILAPHSAPAEPTPAPITDTPRTPFEQYQLDREAYLVAVKARSQQMKLINTAFKDSCDKAARDFKVAMSTARTPDQKNSAATIRKNAVSAAIVARDNAIAALGPEPVAPIEPARPLKINSKKKQR